MKVKDLVAELQKHDQDAKVFMGYDGNIVVTEPAAVEAILAEEQIGDVWTQVEIGSVVILCDR